MKLAREDKEDYLVFGSSFLAQMDLLLCLTLLGVASTA